MAEPLLATTVRQSHAVGCIIVWSAQTLDRLGGLWGGDTINAETRRHLGRTPFGRARRRGSHSLVSMIGSGGYGPGTGKAEALCA